MFYLNNLANILDILEYKYGYPILYKNYLIKKINEKESENKINILIKNFE